MRTLSLHSTETAWASTTRLKKKSAANVAASSLQLCGILPAKSSAPKVSTGGEGMGCLQQSTATIGTLSCGKAVIELMKQVR